MKEKKPPTLKTWIVPRLRRLSYQWPPRNQAKANARVSRGKYKCAICQRIFGPQEVVLDHINPVVPVDGYVDLGSFVESLFCNIEGYQVLCHEDHDKKTVAENIIRNSNKKLDSK